MDWSKSLIKLTLGVMNTEKMSQATGLDWPNENAYGRTEWVFSE